MLELDADMCRSHTELELIEVLLLKKLLGTFTASWTQIDNTT